MGECLHCNKQSQLWSGLCPQCYRMAFGESVPVYDTSEGGELARRYAEERLLSDRLGAALKLLLVIDRHDLNDKRPCDSCRQSLKALNDYEASRKT